MVGDGPATLDQLKGTQYQWSVMTAAAPVTQAAAVAKVIKASGWKNILGLADVLTIDQETLDLLGQAAAADGFKFTKMADTFGFDQQDFQPILNKMMEQINTLKPDAIFLYVNPIGFPPIYKGLRGLGVTLPILAGTACAHPAIFARARRPSTACYVMDSGGIINPPTLPDTWPLKQMQLDFAQRYQAKYNELPDFFSADGADLVTVLVAAMKQAGELDQAKVAQALINLKDVPTLEGMMSLSPDATSDGRPRPHGRVAGEERPVRAGEHHPLAASLGPAPSSCPSHARAGGGGCPPAPADLPNDRWYKEEYDRPDDHDLRGARAETTTSSRSRSRTGCR